MWNTDTIMSTKEDKLKEAEYFLQMMKDTYEDAEALNHNYSAFLNASRCVIQYTYEDVKHVPANRKWYEHYVSNNKVITYFQEKRNINIHERPVTNDSRSVTIHMNCAYLIAGQKEEAKKWKPPTSTSVSKITNWNDVEQEIVDACSDYTVQIKQFLADGKNKGLIC